MRTPAMLATCGALLLSACAGSPPKPFSPALPPGDDEALIYIYRPGDAALSETATIYIDGVRIAEFPPWAYTYVYIKPGTYKVMTQQKASDPKFTSDDSFAAGATYVIRLGESLSFTLAGATTYLGPSLNSPSEERAQRELAQCTYRSPRKLRLGD